MRGEVAFHPGIFAIMIDLLSDPVAPRRYGNEIGWRVWRYER